MPSNDVILLGYRPRNDQQTTSNFRRAVSEDCLLEGHSRSAFSMLKLSKTRISVGDSITVYWDIREQCGANDWIGLFDLDGPTSLSNYLDCKQRGVTGAKRGAIKWAINRDVTLGEVENKCIFKYINGSNSSVKAISPTLYIYNPYAELTSPHGRPRLGSLVPQETLLEFSISGLQANSLKKNIFGKPSPYVKLSIMPSRRHLRSWKQHHGQIAKTSSQTNTINPKWNNEEFVFLGGAEDLLEVEVRNKFSGTRPAFSRFLGKLTVPLVDIFQNERNRPEEFTKSLGRRTPADRVQGTISLTITIIEPSNHPGAASAEQENVPPATASGETSSESPHQSNPRCTLSNSSLTSSAPNILQPLTLNSSNGLLETIFPVDHTPSPTSPHGASMLGNVGQPGHCRRRLEQRPFSELYSEEFVPLDDVDVTSPELSRNLRATNNESNNLSANDTTDAENLGDNRTSSSLPTSTDVESPDETIDQGQESQNAPDNTDGNSSPEASASLTQETEENNQDLENQGMEIPDESSDVNDPEVEMGLLEAGQRNSVGSIELTEDSPLRILEESERVREERIALSRENLLQDPTAESEDELEQMDVTDETIAEQDNSQISDYLMEDVLTSGNITQETLNESNSVETQLMTERETDLLEAASDGLLDEEVDDPNVSSVEEPEEFGASPPVVESLPGASSLIDSETEPAGDMTAAEENLQQPAENSENEPSEQQEANARNEPVSLLEYVDQIIVEGEDNAMVVEPAGDSVQGGTSSPDSTSGPSEEVGPSAVDSSNAAMPSVTLPTEASEPVCLDATSLQSASASEMIVDTPSVDYTVQSGVSNDGSGGPHRPPRGKRLSRSSSDPRNTHSRRRAERSRNAARGSNQGEDSARLSRPPLVRRVTEPTTSVASPSVVPVDTAALSEASNTMAVATPVTDSTANPEVFSPRESVVMAVPMSPPPQRTSSTSSSTSVVVANIVAEAEGAAASVTPLPSPERTNSTSDEQPAVVAVTSEAVSRTSGSPTSRDSPDDYVLIVPSESGQTSSAPSTLRRGEVVSAVTSISTNETQVQHRRVSSQDNTSSVIYATPVSGLSRELTDQLSASFPRQSSAARVTALSGNRRRSSSSSSGYTVSRTMPEESQSLPRNYGHTVSSSTAAVVTASATLNSGQSRSNAAPSHGASTPAGLSSQSGSNLNQSREAIQNMLRSYCMSSTHPGGPPSAARPPRPPATSGQEPEAGRRPSQPSNRNGTRRGSGRRLQGNPVHLSIQDPQQARGQQARQEQQPSEEEPLPPNWERGVDSHGRVYYIDHVNRTTTWNRPQINAPESEANMNDINTHWQSLDRRYQSFRRTLRGRSGRQSRVPLPMDNNRESQTTGESSAASGSAETGATPTRPSSATPSQATPSSSTPSASFTPSSSAAPSSSSAPYSPHPQPGPSTPSTPSEPSTSAAPPTTSTSSSRSANHVQSPAVKFLTRYDLIDFLKSKGVAGHYYFQSQMLKLIVSKIRSEPSQFERYRHQVELVRFLNQFADPQMDMPVGWDKKVDQSGRLYFIDHNTRTTTFIDPRLPVEETLPRRNRSETEPRDRARARMAPPRPPPPRTPSRSSSLTNPTPLTYNQQVVAFMSQPNIDDVLKNKYPGYGRSPTLKANVRRVQTEGERALGRLSNNLDFIMLLSVMEESIVSYVPTDAAQTTEPTSQPASPTRPQATPGTRTRSSSAEMSLKGAMGDSTASSSPAPYKRDFEAKVRSFHRQLYHKGYGQGPNKIKLSIRRDHILEDAYDQIMKEPARAIQRNRLEIQFAGEEGLDYGGPAREFFFLLSRQVFNPYYGLFEYSANDTYTVQVSPVSLYVDNSHEWFRFCGRIIGLVIIHQHLLDAFFTRPFYKALLRSLCDLSDVEAMDSLFHQSMTWVTENDITGALDLSFTVSEEIFGQVTERELIPGGKDIEVTENNKHEYVEQMVRWRVERGVAEQMESIVNGFNEVLDPNLISLFDARELELVISGTADIDIEDWRKNTEYRSGYHGNHKVIRWFWKVVRSFDNEQRLRLLQFVTGTSSIPYEGFAALRGSTGPRKFCIERWGDFSKLPRAHTCFNRLDLPLYRTYEELLEKLTFAVEESETFAMQ